VLRDKLILSCKTDKLHLTDSKTILPRWIFKPGILHVLMLILTLVDFVDVSDNTTHFEYTLTIIYMSCFE